MIQIAEKKVNALYCRRRRRRCIPFNVSEWIHDKKLTFIMFEPSKARKRQHFHVISIVMCIWKKEIFGVKLDKITIW